MRGCTEVSLTRFGDRELQEHKLRFWVIGKHQQAQSSGVLSIKQAIIDRIDTTMDVKYHDGNRFYCSYPPPYLDSLFVVETLRL
jgi:anti-sigma-K factor RskA